MGVILVSPQGNLEVWPEKLTAAKIAGGYVHHEDWRQEKEAELEAQKQAWTQSPEGQAELFTSLRQARDTRVAQTDYLLLADYPLDLTRREAVLAYRQALRDLPSLAGAPWDGGGPLTPWPLEP